MPASSPPRAPLVGVATTPTEVQLDWGVSAHARRLFYLALVGLALAVVTRRAELVGFAAPALALLGAWRAPRPASVRVTLRLSATRVYEGEQVAVDVEIEGQDGHGCEVLGHPSDGVQMVRGRVGRDNAGLVLQVDHSGRRAPGSVEVVIWDRYGLFECHSSVLLPQVACYPRPAQHRDALALGRLTARSGDHPARSPGEGAEFAGVRQYAAGDRQRSINWAATTRRGRLQVNTFAAERSQDVVLVVDGTSDVGRAGSTSLDLSLRGALGVARAYRGPGPGGPRVLRGTPAVVGPGHGQQAVRPLDGGHVGRRPRLVAR